MELKVIIWGFIILIGVVVIYLIYSIMAGKRNKNSGKSKRVNNVNDVLAKPIIMKTDLLEQENDEAIVLDGSDVAVLENIEVSEKDLETESKLNVNDLLNDIEGVESSPEENNISNDPDEEEDWGDIDIEAPDIPDVTESDVPVDEIRNNDSEEEINLDHLSGSAF